MHRQRIGAWAGMAGPALFVFVFLLEGWLRPGYDAGSQFVSELALGPRGWVQIANFLLTGGLLLVFAWGAAAVFPGGKAARSGPILLGLMALLLVASGLFVMDPDGTPPAAATWHGTLHNLCGALFFVLGPTTALVYWRRFRSEPGWRGLAPWTLGAALVMIAAIVLMAIKTPSGAALVAAWDGLVQRVLIITLMGWLFAFARRMHRVTPAA